LLHALIVARFHILPDSPNVLASLRAHQAAEVTSGVLTNVSALDHKVMAEVVAESHEAPGHTGQVVSFIFVGFSLFSVGKKCKYGLD
jgi:hypothetical protein